MNKRTLIYTACFFLISLFFIILYFNLSSRYSFIQDDTFISIRYADNLASGNGLVFNQGDKTEGFTSLLHVLILSGAIKLGLDPVAFSLLFSRIAGILTILLTLMTGALLLKILFPDAGNNYLKFYFHPLLLLIFPLFILNRAFIYWTSSGMDTSLFILLITGSLFSLLYNLKSNTPNLLFISLSIISALTRPEALFFITLFVAVKLSILKYKYSLSPETYIKKEVLPVILILLLLVFLRILYYGYPLPNTFYAKSGFTLFHLKRGAEYLLGFLKGNMLYGILLIFPFAAAVYKRNLLLVLLSLISILFCSIITLIGGDVLPLHRLFFPALPLIYITSLSSVLILIKQSALRYSLALLLAGGAVYSSFIHESGTADEKREYELGLVAKMSDYAGWVSDRQEARGKKAIVALSTIGAFSYYSGSTVIDIAGLTDKFIAHNPVETPGITDSLPVLWKERTYNADYVLSREPDYIIFPAGGKPSAFPECALFVQRKFFENYYTQLVYSNELREFLPVYARRKQKLKLPENTLCDNSFTADYINAANLFLGMIKSGRNSALGEIERLTEAIIKKCPYRISEALVLNGMAEYHVKRFDYAEKCFLESLKYDSLNSTAYLYLKNISLVNKDTVTALKYILRLKEISPGAVPTINN